MTTRPIHFDNSFAALPAGFYHPQNPTPVTKPQLIRLNHALAAELGIDETWFTSEEALQTFAGNLVPPGADPLAAVYAGHQFGSFNPQLGDGRAMLLGEIISPEGTRFDMQLKGSGPTPYSRGGDGRAPLGPVLREYIVSEAMARLGIPTSRALAAVSTGESVYREEVLPGAVLTRIARSHLRIGTLEYFSAKGDKVALKLMADYVIHRHYPQIKVDDGERNNESPYLALLSAVMDKQAELVARWQLLGFIHGVMNTDNVLLSGETIDYGPCAFMDNFDPATVFSSIDRGARYAYQQQPTITHWNLACLAQALLPLIDDDPERAIPPIRAVLDSFPDRYRRYFNQGLLAKIGLVEDQADQPGQALLALMAIHEVDFTLTFARLTEIASGQMDGPVAGLIELPTEISDWARQWLLSQPDAALMQSVNPVLIPRNHLIAEAIAAAENSGDLAPFHQLVDALGNPFDYARLEARYARAPRPEERVQATFCGT